MSSRRMQCGFRREVGRHQTGDRNVQIDFRGGRVNRIGVGLVAYADTTCRSGRRMRSRALSWTGRRMPSVRARTLPGRLLWGVPQHLEWLPSRLLARAMGSLPEYSVSRKAARRGLEIDRWKRMPSDLIRGWMWIPVFPPGQREALSRDHALTKR
jgi:hypothetical protein